MFSVADAGRPGPAAGEGNTGELQGPDDKVLEAGVAVDPLAQIEDQVGPANPREPAEIAHADGQELYFVPPAPKYVPYFMNVGDHGRDVLGTPFIAAGIEQDRNFHQATSARSERPLIRRHAMSATVRMRSS
jgi:hypothetical protein